MAATSVVASGNAVGPDVLRSLPVRVFLKKARPKYLRACGGSIQNPNVDCTKCCRLRGCCHDDTSPFCPTEVKRYANCRHTFIHNPSTSWIGFTSDRKSTRLNSSHLG